MEGDSVFRNSLLGHRPGPDKIGQDLIDVGGADQFRNRSPDRKKWHSGGKDVSEFPVATQMLIFWPRAPSAL